MESELHALQHVAQEMSALQKVIGRILSTFQEVEVKEVPGVLYSDSESALKLLRNLDVPRKSRHLEIRIEWIKERVSLGQLSLIFRKGVDNPSDLLTKCLGSAAFGIHRSTLGFQVSEGSLAGLVAVAKRSWFSLRFVAEKIQLYVKPVETWGFSTLVFPKTWRNGQSSVS